MTTDPFIRLDNVCKYYARGRTTVHALDGVSLEVPKGALVLLRGPSGSGKSTLINVAAGLTRPTSGSLSVAGERLERLSTRARAMLRARRIAVVFQMFHLVPYLPALENVMLPTLAAPSGDALARANQLMADLGIAGRAAHFPSEMSVGERQRCALARALLNRPEVILADEPTGNLDEESAQHVLEMLDACRKEGATIVLASHQHTDALDADLEFHLKDGKIET